jgi:hypothetical protein
MFKLEIGICYGTGHKNYPIHNEVFFLVKLKKSGVKFHPFPIFDNFDGGFWGQLCEFWFFLNWL